jgi:hypothetical protein
MRAAWACLGPYPHAFAAIIHLALGTGTTTFTDIDLSTGALGRLAGALAGRILGHGIGTAAGAVVESFAARTSCRRRRRAISVAVALPAVGAANHHRPAIWTAATRIDKEALVIHEHRA